MSIGIRGAKVVALSLFFLFCAFISISSWMTTPVADASSGGAPTGRTGAPGETTCTACHEPNAGVGVFNIVAPATYTPGQTYLIQVQHSTTDTSRRAWGFELIPVTSGNAMAGSVANVGNLTRVRVSGTKSYVTHTSAGTFSGQQLAASWSFNWTAPATSVGRVTMYAAGLQADNDGNDGGDQTYTTNITIDPFVPVVIRHGVCDFDGDGRADRSIFRPSTGTWYVNGSTSGFMGAQWGSSTDRVTPADFDGDDKTDIAVWRPEAPEVAAFYILQSSNATVRTERFGQNGDTMIAVGDWDGDGKADPAVYRNSAVGSQSFFYYRGSLNNPNGQITFVPWGTTGDLPMRGDFDGDGRLDAAVYRPSDSIWYILQSSNGQVRYEKWGLATDKFVNADYDGDGKTDPAVFRNGVWYIKQSLNGQMLSYNWGLSSDVLVPADYDADGKTDVAVYRGGTWYVRMSSTGALSAGVFGLGSDIALPNAFVQ